jgi:hypothetical protein
MALQQTIPEMLELKMLRALSSGKTLKKPLLMQWQHGGRIFPISELILHPNSDLQSKWLCHALLSGL